MNMSVKILSHPGYGSLSVYCEGNWPSYSFFKTFCLSSKRLLQFYISDRESTLQIQLVQEHERISRKLVDYGNYLHFNLRC